MIKDVLVRAQQILKDGAWTKGAIARDAYGLKVSPDAYDATCWCAIGAIDKAALELYGEIPHKELNAIIDSMLLQLPDPFWLIGTFNDAPETTLEDVINLFQRAIDAT